MIYRRLNDQEIVEFKQWARDNYQPGTPINSCWHPYVQQECRLMNIEMGLIQEDYIL